MADEKITPDADFEGTGFEPEETAQDNTNDFETEVNEAGQEETQVEEVTDADEVYETETEEDGYDSQFGELDDATVDSAYEAVNPFGTTEVKKKSVKTPIIITAIVVVVLALLAGAAYFIFFDNSINGVWQSVQYYDKTTGSTVASGKEDDKNTQKVVTYYEFKDDKLTLYSGDEYMQSKNTFTCKITVKEEKTTIEVVEDKQTLATFDAKIDGNGFTGKNLTLTMQGSTEPMKFTKVFSPDLGELKKLDKFKVDKKIVGNWENKENKVTYNFGEDGVVIMTNTSTGISERKMAYRVDGTKLYTKSTAESEEVETEFKYADSNNSIVFGSDQSEVKFTKIKD